MKPPALSPRWLAPRTRQHARGGWRHTDRERFELSIPGSPVCRFSRPVPSTTRPPVQEPCKLDSQAPSLKPDSKNQEPFAWPSIGGVTGELPSRGDHAAKRAPGACVSWRIRPERTSKIQISLSPPRFEVMAR